MFRFPVGSLLRGQVEGDRLMFEMVPVGPVTEGFITGAPTSAERYPVPASQAILVPVLICDFEISCNDQRSVAVHCDFCAGHSYAFGAR